MENRLNIPVKFLFPRFEEIHWMVAWKWNNRLKENRSEHLGAAFLARAKTMHKTLKTWLSLDATKDNGTRKKKSAFLKEMGKQLKQLERSGRKKGAGGKAGSNPPRDLDDSSAPALPKLKLTLSTKASLDLTDRNNVRHLLQNPVPRTLESELEGALQDFDDQSDEEQKEKEKGKEKKGKEEEETGKLLINLSGPVSSSPPGNAKTRVSSRQHLKKLQRDALPTEHIRQVYQDDDFVYPALDFSDDEDMEEMKKQERKKDANWKPKAKVGSVGQKMERSRREGVAKIEVQRGLQEMAAKKATRNRSKAKKKEKQRRREEEAEAEREREKEKEKERAAARVEAEAEVLPSTPSLVPAASLSSHGALMRVGGPTPGMKRPATTSPPFSPSKASKVKRLLPEKVSESKPKKPKGMATAKQRLGKLLKLKF